MKNSEEIAAAIPPQWTLRIAGDKTEFAFGTYCFKGTTHLQELEQLYRSPGAVYYANIAYLGGNLQSAQLALPVSGQI